MNRNRNSTKHLLKVHLIQGKGFIKSDCEKELWEGASDCSSAKSSVSLIGLKSTFLGLHWQSNKLIQEIKCSALGQILLEQPLCRWPAAWIGKQQQRIKLSWAWWCWLWRMLIIRRSWMALRVEGPAAKVNHPWWIQGESLTWMNHRWHGQSDEIRQVLLKGGLGVGYFSYTHQPMLSK